MQADPNSHQRSQKDPQAQGEMTDPLQNTSSVEQPLRLVQAAEAYFRDAHLSAALVCLLQLALLQR